MNESVQWFTPEPGETTDEFTDRVAASWPPFTDAEKVELRAIFRPVLDSPAQLAKPEAA
jgi:hypothetical protein